MTAPPNSDNSPNNLPLKVAILHFACAPIVGGVESIMTTHARLLNAAGHKAFLVAGRGNPAAVGLEGTIIPELDSRHPSILRVQTALLEGGAEEEFAFWVERICGLLTSVLSDIDVCIAHNVFTLHKNLPLTLALAQMAGEGKGADRWVAWCHDLAWNNPLYAGDLRPGWPWDVLRTPMPNVAYVAISEQRRAEMAHLFHVPASSIHLIPNGLDPTTFLPCSHRMASLRNYLHWDRRDCVLLAPVRVTRRKNLSLALRVTAEIKRYGENPLLVVTGPPGPHNVLSDEYMRELLEQRHALDIEENAIFLALEGNEGRELQVGDDLIGELYWWSDALLLPSEQEGFGLPLLEAGLARLPTFCSDIPVLREVGGDNAVYFSLDEDPARIAETILHVLEMPGPTAMRRKVLSTYSWGEIFSQRLMPLLRET